MLFAVGLVLQSLDNSLEKAVGVRFSKILCVVGEIVGVNPEPVNEGGQLGVGRVFEIRDILLVPIKGGKIVINRA